MSADPPRNARRAGTGLFMILSRAFGIIFVFLVSAVPVHGAWWVDQSAAASHLGGPSRSGPFATRAAAEAYIAANPNYGMQLESGGYDDGNSSSSSSASVDDEAARALGSALGQRLAQMLFGTGSPGSVEDPAARAAYYNLSAAQKAQLVAAVKAQEAADAATKSRLQSVTEGTAGGFALRDLNATTPLIITDPMVVDLRNSGTTPRLISTPDTPVLGFSDSIVAKTSDQLYAEMVAARNALLNHMRLIRQYQDAVIRNGGEATEAYRKGRLEAVNEINKKLSELLTGGIFYAAKKNIAAYMESLPSGFVFPDGSGFGGGAQKWGRCLDQIEQASNILKNATDADDGRGVTEVIVRLQSASELLNDPEVRKLFLSAGVSLISVINPVGGLIIDGGTIAINLGGQAAEGAIAETDRANAEKTLAELTSRYPRYLQILHEREEDYAASIGN